MFKPIEELMVIARKERESCLEKSKLEGRTLYVVCDRVSPNPKELGTRDTPARPLQPGHENTKSSTPRTETSPKKLNNARESLTSIIWNETYIEWKKSSRPSIINVSSLQAFYGIIRRAHINLG